MDDIYAPERLLNRQDEMAVRLTKITGYNVQWVGSCSCYTLWDGQYQRFPLYTTREVFELAKKLRALVPKGDLYGECSRSVCDEIACHQHKHDTHRYYCHKCMLAINEQCGEEVVHTEYGKQV